MWRRETFNCVLIFIQPDSDSEEDEQAKMEVTEEGEQKEEGPSHANVVSVPSQKEIEEMLIRRKKKVIHVTLDTVFTQSDTAATIYVVH